MQAESDEWCHQTPRAPPQSTIGRSSCRHRHRSRLACSSTRAQAQHALLQVAHCRRTLPRPSQGRTSRPLLPDRVRDREAGQVGDGSESDQPEGLQQPAESTTVDRCSGASPWIVSPTSRTARLAAKVCHGPDSPRCAPDTRKHAQTGQSAAHDGQATGRSRQAERPVDFLELLEEASLRSLTTIMANWNPCHQVRSLAATHGDAWRAGVSGLLAREGARDGAQGGMSESMEEGGAVEPPSCQGARARREGTLRGARGRGWTSRTRCALASPTCAPSCPPFSACKRVTNFLNREKKERSGRCARFY